MENGSSPAGGVDGRSSQSERAKRPAPNWTCQLCLCTFLHLDLFVKHKRFCYKRKSEGDDFTEMQHAAECSGDDLDVALGNVVCRVDSRRSWNKRYLERAERGVRSWTCRICGCTFHTLEVLVKHERFCCKRSPSLESEGDDFVEMQHAAECSDDDFVVTLCNVCRVAGRSSQNKQGKRADHGWVCWVCGRRFRCMQVMQNHRRTCDGSCYMCRLCGCTFKYMETLKYLRHQRTCDKRSPSPE